MSKFRKHAGMLAGLLALCARGRGVWRRRWRHDRWRTCGTTEPSAVSGSIVISGSSTVEPISSIVAEIFNETNPERRDQRRRSGYR